MGLCIIIASMSKALRVSKLSRTPQQTLVLNLLELMPVYQQAANLGLWEYHVQTCLVDESNGNKNIINAQTEQTINSLINQIFELGRFNLYGQFKPKETQQEIHWLQNAFSYYDIPLYLSENPINDW